MIDRVPKSVPVHRPALALPDPDALPAGELRDKLGEVASLRERARAAHHEAVESGYAVERAEEADRQALADFARGKTKTKPKPTAPAAAKKVEDLERADAVAVIALGDAEAELRELMDQHAPALAEAERGRAKAAVAEAHAAAIKAAEHLAERHACLQRALYWSDPERGFRQPAALGSQAIQKTNGSHVSPDEALAIVIEATDPDPPPPITDEFDLSQQAARREWEQARAEFLTA